VGFNLKKYKYEYKRGEEEYELYRIDTKNKNDNLILIFLWRSKSDLWKICKVKRHFISPKIIICFYFATLYW